MTMPIAGLKIEGELWTPFTDSSTRPSRAVVADFSSSICSIFAVEAAFSFSN
jgi:hypothetical protein